MLIVKLFKPALGVAHRCRAVVRTWRSKLPVTVDQGVTKTEVLHHSRQRVIDRGIAVGVKATPSRHRRPWRTSRAVGLDDVRYPTSNRESVGERA